MPIDYRKYPENWKTEIRPRILKRANHCCERCGVENGSWIRRWKKNAAVYNYDRLGNISEWGEPIKIVLTIAHLDNKLVDHSDENLQAMCQRCHLTHDAFMRKMEKKQ